ncbi:lipopolysaccharide transport system permease protein [Mesonia phycicola]|uniref:Lipopolysaccharide transport system permease protein n=1 Tax=Mesonia phycicola TaxID=579105 RepID=A0A1M6AN87_9FLAO|nr:ABC transporter permease [Mesonia phycicola]SHI37946.1 lipopolysaccharide transport system permease protein [Mesonia phycicola]
MGALKPMVKIYQKEQSLSFFKIIKESLQDIYASRFLSRQLAERDIKAQYRQSILGIFWAFVTPLATAFVWIFLRSSGTVEVTDTGIPYPLFAFTGTLLWSIIIESVNSPITSTNSSKSILSKINFPKEALIISGAYKVLFNSLFKFLLLLVFLFYFGVGFHPTLLLFPIGIVIMVFVGNTIGLLITPIGMLYNDVAKAIKFGFQFLMYVTPVVFAIPAKEGIMKTIMEWNPFTPLILTVRGLGVGNIPADLTYFWIVLGGCVPLFLIGLVFYRISIPIFVERLSA